MKKKIKAFSLIELLISLIVISLIIASFTPVLSKKLKHRELALAAKSTSIDCISKFGEDCLACNDSSCTICRTSFSVPEGKFVNPEQGCQYQECSNKFGTACTRCNKDYCTGCKGGWGYNSTAHSCNLCYAPSYSIGGANACKTCNNGYEYQDDNGQSGCKYCDSANGWFPNGDRKGCTQTTCGKGYHREGSDCNLCSGNNSYQPNDNYSGSTCYTCREHEVANTDHSGCNCVASSYTISNGTCISCNSSGCSAVNCNSGYHPSGISCAQDVAVCTGATYLDSATNTCKNCFENCASCSDGSTCNGCKADYKLATDRKSCAYDPCYEHNAIYFNEPNAKFCIKKKNLGDEYSTASIVSGWFTGTTSATNPRCWQTGGRTVCNWPAGDEGCRKLGTGWTLPTYDQLNIIKNNFSTLQTDLQLCSSNNSKSPYCAVAAGCTDTHDNKCYPRDIWGQVKSGKTKPSYLKYEGSIAFGNSDSTEKKNAFSVRCVKTFCMASNGYTCSAAQAWHK